MVTSWTLTTTTLANRLFFLSSSRKIKIITAIALILACRVIRLIIHLLPGDNFTDKLSLCSDHKHQASSKRAKAISIPADWSDLVSTDWSDLVSIRGVKIIVVTMHREAEMDDYASMQ